jgi:hypothetical protein
MRDYWKAIVSAWRAGYARFYEVRQRQRRRHLPDPFMPK